MQSGIDLKKKSFVLPIILCDLRYVKFLFVLFISLLVASMISLMRSKLSFLFWRQIRGHRHGVKMKAYNRATFLQPFSGQGTHVVLVLKLGNLSQQAVMKKKEWHRRSNRFSETFRCSFLSSEWEDYDGTFRTPESSSNGVELIWLMAAHVMIFIVAGRQQRQDTPFLFKPQVLYWSKKN